MTEIKKKHDLVSQQSVERSEKDLQKIEYIKTAAEKSFPVTGSFAAMVQFGEPVDSAISKAGDIDVVVGQSDMSVLSLNLPDKLFDDFEAGWKERLIHRKLNIDGSEINVKLASLYDIYRRQIEFWQVINNRTDFLNAMQVNKLLKQLKIIAAYANTDIDEKNKKPILDFVDLATQLIHNKNLSFNPVADKITSESVLETFNTLKAVITQSKLYN